MHEFSPKLNNDTRSQIQVLYKQGTTVVTLSQQFGVSKQTIYRTIKKSIWGNMTPEQWNRLSKENVIRITKRFSNVDKHSR